MVQMYFHCSNTEGMLVDRSEVTHKKDYEHLSNLELLQLLAKEARELELLEYQGKVIDALPRASSSRGI